MFRFLSNLFASESPARSAPNTNRSRLGVDALEARECPSALGADDFCGSTPRLPIPPRDMTLMRVEVLGPDPTPWIVNPVNDQVQFEPDPIPWIVNPVGDQVQFEPVPDPWNTIVPQEPVGATLPPPLQPAGTR